MPCFVQWDILVIVFSGFEIQSFAVWTWLEAKCFPTIVENDVFTSAWVVSKCFPVFIVSLQNMVYKGKSAFARVCRVSLWIYVTDGDNACLRSCSLP